MIWTTWTNGTSSYGFKINRDDRDKYFDKEWKYIILELPSLEENVEIMINTDKKSFWNNTCRELINIRIKKWLEKSKYIPWEPHNPPKFEVQYGNTNRFRLIKKIENLTIAST